MRVVLKPAGVIAALVVVGYMIFTILNYTKEVQSPDAFREPTPSTTATPTQELTNGGFEKPFSVAQVFGNPASSKSKVSGDLAAGWLDNSDWADATIAYAPDSVSPHGGEASQRMELQSVGKKGGSQICQKVSIFRGRVYRASVWVRAKAATDVSLLVRPSGNNLRVKPVSKSFPVGTGWKQLSVELDARDMTVESADALLIIGFYTPKMTIWVDDVEFSEAKKI